MHFFMENIFSKYFAEIDQKQKLERQCSKPKVDISLAFPIDTSPAGWQPLRKPNWTTPNSDPPIEMNGIVENNQLLSNESHPVPWPKRGTLGPLMFGTVGVPEVQPPPRARFRWVEAADSVVDPKKWTEQGRWVVCPMFSLHFTCAPT